MIARVRGREHECGRHAHTAQLLAAATRGQSRAYYARASPPPHFQSRHAQQRWLTRPTLNQGLATCSMRKASGSTDYASAQVLSKTATPASLLLRAESIRSPPPQHLCATLTQARHNAHGFSTAHAHEHVQAARDSALLNRIKVDTPTLLCRERDTAGSDGDWESSDDGQEVRLRHGGHLALPRASMPTYVADTERHENTKHDAGSWRARRAQGP